MNLAEIRKKALAERGGEHPSPAYPSSGTPAAPHGVEHPPSSPVSGRGGDPAVDPAQAEQTRGDTPPCPVTEEGGDTLVQSLSLSFDPVSMILKGRDVADQVIDPELVAERSQLMAESRAVEYLCFRVGTEFYAVPISEIKEIIKPRELTEVPRSPSFVKGILSLRGVIIPVFDMRERLHFEPAVHDSRSRIVVVRKGEELCGILVDEVLQVLHFEEKDIEPPPSVLDGLDREFVSGIGRHDARVIILLCLENILDMQRI